MRILLTGSNGMLGGALKRHLEIAGHIVTDCDLPGHDILDEGNITELFSGSRPEIVYHCAAYTAVDRAEQEPRKAFDINENGTCVIAGLCSRFNARLVVMSTDYVFSGTKTTPYTEEDEPDPHGVYAASKRAGELKALKVPGALVVRTSWLYGKGGKNFVDTIVGLARSKSTLRVVCDQTGSPTSTLDLALALAQIPQKPGISGILHLSGQGQCTWYEFARRAVELAGLSVRIEPVTTRQYPLAAPRPAYSVLDNTKARNAGLILRPWPDALAEYLK